MSRHRQRSGRQEPGRDRASVYEATCKPVVVVLLGMIARYAARLLGELGLWWRTPSATRWA